jgi:hypothetical protein
MFNYEQMRKLIALTKPANHKVSGLSFALMSYALSLNTMGLSREIPNASQEAVNSISIS